MTVKALRGGQEFRQVTSGAHTHGPMDHNGIPPEFVDHVEASEYATFSGKALKMLEDATVPLLANGSQAAKDSFKERHFMAFHGVYASPQDQLDE